MATSHCVVRKKGKRNFDETNEREDQDGTLTGVSYIEEVGGTTHFPTSRQPCLGSCETGQHIWVKELGTGIAGDKLWRVLSFIPSDFKKN